jgi:hypothetical protein
VAAVTVPERCPLREADSSAAAGLYQRPGLGLHERPWGIAGSLRCVLRKEACTVLVEVYYRWRPNLPDESDNHVLELAVAAGSATILTFNRKDFSRGELQFPGVAIQPPANWLRDLKE